MANFVKVLLSESVDGKPVHVVASGTPGTSVHTAVTGTSNMDEIWLYAQNKSSATISLSIEYGDPICVTCAGITAQDGLHLMIPGLIINNSEVVKAFATASGIDIYGFVNRIS